MVLMEPIMPLTPDAPPSITEIIYSLTAAAAGRAMLLFGVHHGKISVEDLVKVVVWELPMICACSFFGGMMAYAAGIDGYFGLLIIGVLANKGPAAFGPLFDAFFEVLVSWIKKRKP